MSKLDDYRELKKTIANVERDFSRFLDTDAYHRFKNANTCIVAPDHATFMETWVWIARAMNENTILLIDTARNLMKETQDKKMQEAQDEAIETIRNLAREG